MDFPPSSILKKALQNHCKSPVIFKNSLTSWAHVPSTIEQLLTQYGDILLNFRLVSKSNKGISWEGSTEYIQAKINQFIEWRASKNSHVDCSNPFHKYMEQDFWAYSSYNYMSHIFNEDADILKAVNWTAFGYPETSGKDSAFWIGSKDSYTPCHFDTYGFNLIAQIQGRKKWILFPPKDTPFMYPTRIPYEESSVFSSVNILNPDLKMHPLFKFSHPHVVILEPGDILFVPNKWWHFVQSLDMTVSINTWIEQTPKEPDSHLEEAITRALMSSYISFFEPVGESWLNPNEEVVSPEESIKYIEQELNKIKSLNVDQNSQKDDSFSPAKKLVKIVTESDVHSNISDDQIEALLQHKDIHFVTPEIFSNWYGKSIDKCRTSGQDINVKNIIDCFVHPEVISVISKLLKDM